MIMKRRGNEVVDREQAIRYGILPEEQVRHWTEIEEGRFQPRRTRGSYRGRASLVSPGTGDKQPG
jgi:hypothetical protein